MAEDKYYYIVADHKHKVFNVLGPMNLDSQLMDAVCELQKGGRDIRCKVHEATESKEQVTQDFIKETEFAMSEHSILTPKSFHIREIFTS